MALVDFETVAGGEGEGEANMKVSQAAVALAKTGMGSHGCNCWTDRSQKTQTSEMLELTAITTLLVQTVRTAATIPSDFPTEDGTTTAYKHQTRMMRDTEISRTLQNPSQVAAPDKK